MTKSTRERLRTVLTAAYARGVVKRPKVLDPMIADAEAAARVMAALDVHPRLVFATTMNDGIIVNCNFFNTYLLADAGLAVHLSPAPDGRINVTVFKVSRET